MLQPADMLMLDEPTNDLDIPTLEVLESNLADFPGAIVLVTHDRFLLDRLSSVLLAMDGDGRGRVLRRTRAVGAGERAEESRSGEAESEVRSQGAPPAKKKLSYKEAREWEQMEEVLMRAEEILDQKRSQLEVPEVVADPARLTLAVQEMDAAQDEVDKLYARCGGTGGEAE